MLGGLSVERSFSPRAPQAGSGPASVGAGGLGLGGCRVGRQVQGRPCRGCRVGIVEEKGIG